MNTGERIKCYRKQLGMSAEDLAAIINVSPSTIYRYENNDISNMGIDKLQAIASALHTHAYSLMGWGADPAQDSPKIIYIMNQLNEEGQRKVIDYAEDLVASGKYSGPSSPLSPSRARKADKNADIETENIMNEFEKLRALSDD